MKHFKYIAMLMFASTLAFTNCDNATGEDSKKYAIGDIGPSGRGIVFYVTDEGLHGLEAAPVDQYINAGWSNITSTEIGTTSTEIDTGYDNTDAIIYQANHTASAALRCRDYRSDEEGDWYLPSKNELNEMYNNKDTIGNFEEDKYYWSSSEYAPGGAWAQHFGTGTQPGRFKTEINRVRAIRAF
ncbi:MAG TPA: DUF1566 domain-containing protein [Spirochaetota bacterium]|nr:DUF1566 domain-containing protein [Spirochaetota bacterium]